MDWFDCFDILGYIWHRGHNSRYFELYEVFYTTRISIFSTFILCFSWCLKYLSFEISPSWKNLFLSVFLFDQIVNVSNQLQNKAICHSILEKVSISNYPQFVLTTRHETMQNGTSGVSISLIGCAHWTVQRWNLILDVCKHKFCWQNYSPN